MIFSDYYKNIFKRVYVTQDAINLPATKRALEKLSLIPVLTIESEKDIPATSLNSSTLVITCRSRKGQTVGRCPGTKGHICCNYITADLYLGCTLGCSYCIMRSYLNFAPITVYADAKPAIEEIRRIALLNQDKIVRVGTGETGDSLQFDPLFEITEEFITGLSDLENVYFEAKTKTCFVDHLLEIKNKGNAAIGFSLNPQDIIDAEEKEAFSLEERLEAAGKGETAGFNLTFHFDPVICEEGWEAKYRDTVKKLSRFKKEKIKWVSIGTFRYPAELKEKIGQRPYLFDEFVPCADNKYRYLQKRRKEAYKFMYSLLRETTGSAVYFCMESAPVWRYAAGNTPEHLESVDWLFHHIKLL